MRGRRRTFDHKTTSFYIYQRPDTNYKYIFNKRYFKAFKVQFFNHISSFYVHVMSRICLIINIKHYAQGRAQINQSDIFATWLHCMRRQRPNLGIKRGTTAKSQNNNCCDQTPTEDLILASITFYDPLLPQKHPLCVLRRSRCRCSSSEGNGISCHISPVVNVWMQ